MTDTIDLGHGFTARWASWSPDRSIPANAERYAGIPDEEHASLLITCPHGEGFITPDTPVNRVVGKEPFWTVESWDPLTLSPSVLCPCGCHGFIRQGRWIPA